MITITGDIIVVVLRASIIHRSSLMNLWLISGVHGNRFFFCLACIYAPGDTTLRLWSNVGFINIYSFGSNSRSLLFCTLLFIVFFWPSLFLWFLNLGRWILFPIQVIRNWHFLKQFLYIRVILRLINVRNIISVIILSVGILFWWLLNSLFSRYCILLLI